MTENNNDTKNLFYLHDLSDYKVADNYPDVRGWEMKDANNQTIGEVDGLLVNKAEERVVYLDIEVNENIIEAGHKTFAAKASEGVHEFLNEDGDTHLIVPIGMVELDEENKTAKANEIDYDTFAKTPRYKKGSDMKSGYEMVVFKTYLPAAYVDPTTQNDVLFYDHDAFRKNSSKK
jgi:hypothetical protein